MQREYWEKIAPSYSDEIFDVLHNDTKAIIRTAIEKIANKSKTVIDAGCAVGKWLPVLSPAFKKVTAADISAKNLEIAKRTYPGYKNVSYLRTDLSSPRSFLGKYDVAVCINAVLSSSLKKRNTFFQNLSSCLKRHGNLVLAVPSLESWLLTRIVQNQWRVDRSLFNEKLDGKKAISRYRDLQQGNAEIDNVPTKHYLKEELSLLLSKEGFTIEQIERIEYSWKTEFAKPPSWLRQPGPWDWMLLAKKK